MKDLSKIRLSSDYYNKMPVSPEEYNKTLTKIDLNSIIVLNKKSKRVYVTSVFIASRELKEGFTFEQLQKLSNFYNNKKISNSCMKKAISFLIIEKYLLRIGKNQDRFCIINEKKANLFHAKSKIFFGLNFHSTKMKINLKFKDDFKNSGESCISNYINGAIIDFTFKDMSVTYSELSRSLYISEKKMNDFTWLGKEQFRMSVDRGIEGKDISKNQSTTITLGNIYEGKHKVDYVIQRMHSDGNQEIANVSSCELREESCLIDTSKREFVKRKRARMLHSFFTDSRKNFVILLTENAILKGMKKIYILNNKILNPRN